MNATARSRFILLGASNLTRGIGAVLTAAHAIGFPDQPSDCFIAYGHGRSYGIDSRILVRTLPGIVNCQLWNHLDTLTQQTLSTPPATYALITDIGNDIMYGREPSEIAGWVETCLARLQTHSARAIVTALPLTSISQVTRRRYIAARTILFPGNTLPYEDAMSRVEELDDRVRRTARAHGAIVVEPDASWYGIDPIHIRHRHKIAAWNEVLAHWADPSARADHARPYGLASWRRTASVRLARPCQETILGVPRTTPQPAALIADDTHIHLY